MLLVLAVACYVANEKDSKQEEKSTDPKDPKPSYRAAYHLNSPDKWKNDPQKPIYMDGKFHYYYLYNKDYPDGNGTEWRHVTSTDLVHWKDEGIAIPKYTNKNGDPWTGSVVIDENNTAGFGKGALVAIVTQPSADGGKQEQYLWYSQDRGKSFTSYSEKPVMSNPGQKDFRDPKIIWDKQSNRWITLMAEGAKIGFYESSNLKDWTYIGQFETHNIGIVECPDLFPIQANDGTTKWVLGASANGKAYGKPNTYAYWIGNFDGNQFTADKSEPQWLDYGFDWYGAVTFDNGKSSDKRYALAWMNNWDYANNTPTLKENFNGTDSIVREITLQKQSNNEYSLLSQPVQTLNNIVQTTETFNDIKVDSTKTLKAEGDSYVMEADISWSDLANVGVRLRESDDKTRHIDVGVKADEGYTYVNRGNTGQPDESRRLLESKAPFDNAKKNVHLKIFVDKTTIEVFVDDGKVVYSNEVFPELNDKGISLFTEGGTAHFNNVTIKHLQTKGK
ncbi:glycoside hydrolase family 32 protein [Niallia sp. 03133]|uniref:glycoside hydrolase family 32 protein n=1 Tax=Niallia sp. 03133 TaxID=3458060 RepID=UPI004043DC31